VAPCTRGAPTFTDSPSPSASTWSSTTSAPTSAVSFSTFTFSPAATRYCLPPVMMTAYMTTPTAENPKLYMPLWLAVKGGYGMLEAPIRAPFPVAIPAPVALPQRPSLEAIHSVVADDMRSVDALIRRRLDSDVVLVRRIAEHIIGSGGKRLRPALVLISAGAFGYRGACHHELAAVIEFIHTATLLHDDVVDHSEMRRGRRTANAEFGNAASVLVGDFLYSRAFQMMLGAESMR